MCDYGAPVTEREKEREREKESHWGSFPIALRTGSTLLLLIYILYPVIIIIFQRDDQEDLSLHLFQPSFPLLIFFFCEEPDPVSMFEMCSLH